MKHFQFDDAAVKLSGGCAARQFFAPIFAERRRELLVVALCDDNLRLLQLLSIPGTEAYVHFSLPRVMRQAISREDCVGVILAHNHPSGDKRPSAEDLRVTRQMSQAADALELVIFDHLIFNGGPAFSLRELGYL